MGAKNKKLIKKTSVVGFGSYELDVEYTIFPEEPRTHDYPGAGIEVDIHSIHIDMVDVTELFEYIESGFETVEESIIENL